MPSWSLLPEEPAAASPPLEATPADSIGVPSIAISGDASQTGLAVELLGIDRQLSDAIFDAGPLAGYGTAISAEGMLFDSNGPSAPGQDGVAARFRNFPADLKLERRPQRALADGATGSTWGVFAVQRGEQTLTEGFYVTSWRREASGWKIVAELAAGRAPTAAALPSRPAAPTAQAPEPASDAAIGARPRILRDALGRPVQPPATPTPATAPTTPPPAEPRAQSQPPPGG